MRFDTAKVNIIFHIPYRRYEKSSVQLVGEVQAHAGTSHFGTVAQDAAVHLEFASLVKIRHEAVVSRKLKLTVHVVVVQYNTVVLFEFVVLGDKVLGFVTEEVDDQRCAVNRLLPNASISWHKERTECAEQMSKFHLVSGELRLEIEVDSLMRDVATERLIKAVRIAHSDKIVAEVPQLGDFGVRIDIDPTDDGAGGHVHEVRDVAKHLRVVQDHLPFYGVAGDGLLGFSSVD